MRVCEECGFDGDALAPADATTALRAFARRYRAPLTRFLPGEDGDAVVRQRPDAVDVVGARVRVPRARRVRRLRARGCSARSIEDTPTLESMGRDERRAARPVQRAGPGAVADELASNAERLAGLLEGVDADDWERTAIHPYPEPRRVRCSGWPATWCTRAATTCSTSGGCCERCAGSEPP